MSEMLKRVAVFGGENGACGAADPDKKQAYRLIRYACDISIVAKAFT